MKKILFVVLFGLSTLTFADCEFIITNYSSVKLNATIGFYNGESQTLNIPAKGVNNLLLRSDLTCTATTNYGGGVSFIRLGKNINTDGGWVYVPNNEMYRALGNIRKGNTGAFIQSTNKKIILLNNTHKPDADKFSVSIEDAGINQTVHPI